MFCTEFVLDVIKVVVRRFDTFKRGGAVERWRDKTRPTVALKQDLHIADPDLLGVLYLKYSERLQSSSKAENKREFQR